MKLLNKSLLIALALLAPVVAFAANEDPVSRNGDNVSLSAPDSASGNLSIVVPNATAVAKVYSGGAQRIQLDGAGVTSFLAGADMAMVPYTITAAATPVAGTNKISGLISVFPTAAANAAALLGASPTAGTLRFIINSGPNAVRVKPGGTDTINGGAAGAYIPLAAASDAVCFASSTSAWQCHTGVVPTPAGP